MISAMDSFSHAVVFQGEEKGLLNQRYAELCDVVYCPRGRGLPLSYFFRLVRTFKRIQPDAVVAHLFGNHTVVAWAAFLAGVPVTFGVSTNDPVRYSGSRLWPMILAHLARPVCKGEIAVSNFVGQILKSGLLLPSQRVTVICNGCPVEKIAERAASGRASPPVARRDRVARLIMLGAITGNKDCATTVRALHVLRSRGRNVELLIAGKGCERRVREIERVIGELGLGDHVTLLGPRSDAAELLGASDVLVHSSRSEGFAVTITEGMAAGIPIVASDIPSIREALDNGTCGLLAPVGNPEAFADAIETILDDHERREDFVKAALARVRSRYDLKHMARGYETLLMSHLT
jgi:glycosyltransferase involved in cell wall biosynthesis